jgi:hypothetical protein
MKNEEIKKNAKKPYEKPLLRVVNISDGIQTLGQGCKLAGGVVPNYGMATSCGITNYCSVNGS